MSSLSCLHTSCRGYLIPGSTRLIIQYCKHVISRSTTSDASMREYFLLARPQQGPLFYFQSGRLLTRGVVLHLLRDSLRVAGLPYQSLKGHSFRIAAASVAAAAGLPDSLIKVMGHWSSDCYQLYIRTPLSTIESVAPRMANVVKNTRTRLVYFRSDYD